MANDVRQESNPNLVKSMKRSNKPMMERKRRERINSSLEVLKKLVLESLKKDPSQYSKLEKADILEMTVKHLRSVQRQQLTLAAAADSSVVGKYRAGFSECAMEVTRYLSQMEGLHPETRVHLEQHLLKRANQLTEAASQSQAPGFGQYSLPVVSANQQLQVGIPAATPLTSLPGHQQQQQLQQIPVLNTQGVPQFYGTIQMVPGAVLGGDHLTVLLPASQVTSPVPGNHGNHQSGSSSVSPSSVRSSPSASSVSPGGRESSSCPSTPSPVPHHSNHHQAASSSSHHVFNSRHVTSAKSWPQLPGAQNLSFRRAENEPLREERVWRPW